MIAYGPMPLSFGDTRLSDVVRDIYGVWANERTPLVHTFDDRFQVYKGIFSAPLEIYSFHLSQTIACTALYPFGGLGVSRADNVITI